MIDLDRKYQNILIQGWVGMLILLLAMFIMAIVELSIKADFDALSAAMAIDPGVIGLWVMTVFICMNVIVQMLIRSLDSKRFRWLVFYVTVLYTVFFAAHQVSHLLGGEGFGVQFLLDTTHNIVGIWASWAAFKWVKLTCL